MPLFFEGLCAFPIHTCASISNPTMATLLTSLLQVLSLSFCAFVCLFFSILLVVSDVLHEYGAFLVDQSTNTAAGPLMMMTKKMMTMKMMMMMVMMTMMMMIGRMKMMVTLRSCVLFLLLVWFLVLSFSN
jgi:hypothetical protein